MLLLQTKTEESFFNFFNDRKRIIQKIQLENAPDFIVDKKYIFEIKAINPSGTLRQNGILNVQKINAVSVINKYIVDAVRKIENYKIGLPGDNLFALVIYNSRYFTWDHVIDAFSKCEIERYPNVNNLIYAEYNKPSNQTVALHIFNNKSSVSVISAEAFHDLSFKIY